MRVVIAPDSFGGTLSPLEAAEAIAAGWRQARPDDELLLRPMSDGGEGLLVALEAALTASGAAVERRTVEVAGPRGLPVDADFLLLDDGRTAVIESALACGLALVDPERRDPRTTTTWGVGQLIIGAAEAGASRVLVGLGGSATVDGGAGALSGLGFRVAVEDGSGLKIGGEDLPRAADVMPGWVPPSVLALDEVVLLADVDAVLADAAPLYGPQKGADEATVEHLAVGLQAWASVVERTFGRPGLRDEAGTGAAGGLGFGLRGALGARLAPGAVEVAELLELPTSIAGADLVVTGEGRLDATSFDGKVVGAVRRLGEAHGVPVAGLFGQIAAGSDVRSLLAVEVSSPDGPGPDAGPAVVRAARLLAGRLP